MSDTGTCAVCGLKIRRATERDRPWLHDDPAYDPVQATDPRTAAQGGVVSAVVHVDGEILTLHCPACRESHRVHDGSSGWVFNGDTGCPTLNPSIKVTGVQWARTSGFYKPEHANVPAGGETVCHSYVIRGEWQYLADCTHALAGQTVPCVPWEVAAISERSQGGASR